MFNILSNFINPKPLPNGVRTTYKVPPRQNLFEIALQFDCNPWKLKEINNLDNTIIQQGQNLEVFLPSSNSNSHYSYIDRQHLLTINQTIPVIYYAAGYNVKGILQIQYDFLLFMPIHKKLDSEIKNKGDDFEFLAYFREIHKIQYNPMTKIIQIYLWGVNHIMAPVVDGNFFESVMIEIKMNPKKTKQIKPFLKKLCHLGNESSKLKTIEGMTFLFYLLQYEHEYVVEDSLNPLIKSMKFKIKPIECQSKALNYQEVEIDMSEGFIQTKPQSKQQSIKQQMYQPKLSDISRILNDEKCMQLSNSLPQYLQTKDCYQVHQNLNFQEGAIKLVHIQLQLKIKIRKFLVGLQLIHGNCPKVNFLVQESLFYLDSMIINSNCIVQLKKINIFKWLMVLAIVQELKINMDYLQIKILVEGVVIHVKLMTMNNYHHLKIFKFMNQNYGLWMMSNQLNQNGLIKRGHYFNDLYIIIINQNYQFHIQIPVVKEEKSLKDLIYNDCFMKVSYSIMDYQDQILKEIHCVLHPHYLRYPLDQEDLLIIHQVQERDLVRSLIEVTLFSTQSQWTVYLVLINQRISTYLDPFHFILLFQLQFLNLVNESLI